MKLRMLFLALMFSGRLVYASQDCQICNNTANLVDISKRSFDIWSAETNNEYTRVKPIEQSIFLPDRNKGEKFGKAYLCASNYRFNIIFTGKKQFWEITRNDKVSGIEASGNIKVTSDGERTYRLEYSIFNNKFQVPKASVSPEPLSSYSMPGDPIFQAYTILCFFWNDENLYFPVEFFLRGETRAGAVTYEGTEEIDGINCQRFEASDNDSLKVTVWVAPDHDYGIKKAEIITPMEKSSILNKYEQIGDISYLKESRIENHDIHTNEKLQTHLFQTLDFKILKQEDVDEEIFVLKFPDDVNVYRFDLEGDRIPVR